MNLKDMIPRGPLTGKCYNKRFHLCPRHGHKKRWATVKSEYHEEFHYLCRGHSR